MADVVQRCSVQHHRYRFVGRMERDWGEGDGPKRGWLLWESDKHELSREGAVQHWFTIAPEKFWAA